tara:strand:- start:12434 stop:12820 length:387 start_codon:yes stop_codon:yes gene_type:complete
MDKPKRNGLQDNLPLAIGFIILIGGLGAAAFFFAPRFYNPPPEPVSVEVADHHGQPVAREVDGGQIEETLKEQGVKEPTDEQRQQAAQEIAEQEQAAENEEAAKEEEEAKKKPGLFGRIFGGGEEDKE